MKVAVACSGLGHVTRGIESWAVDLGSALAARGVDVTLFKGAGAPNAPYERLIPCWTRTDARNAQLRKLLPKSLAWRLGLGSGYGAEQTTFALRLLPALRNGRFDILHVQDPQVALIAQRAWQLGIIPCPAVFGHATEEEPGFLQKIRYVQHLAPWHFEQARSAGVGMDTSAVIPYFIDTERFRPGRANDFRAELGIPPDAFVVLSAAAIRRPHKRIDYLIREFATLLKDPAGAEARLVVAGARESDTDELLSLGRELLGERVHFLLNFPRDRMPELYRSADVFALCSLFEMFGIVLLEATASGLPCVVHEHPVVEWVVGAGGLAVDMTEPGALAGSLRQLLGDSAQRCSLGERAREHCTRSFSRERVVDKIIEYYHYVTKDAASHKPVVSVK